MIFISHRGNLHGPNKFDENKPDYVLDAAKKKFLISPVEEMWGLGTPEDLNYFLNHSKYTNSKY